MIDKEYGVLNLTLKRLPKLPALEGIRVIKPGKKCINKIKNVLNWVEENEDVKQYLWAANEAAQIIAIEAKRTILDDNGLTDCGQILLSYNTMPNRVLDHLRYYLRGAAINGGILFLEDIK